MNIAIIFAGGTGQRMHSKDRPKQFLFVHGKPIIVHTVEVFQRHPMIDSIVIVCLPEWIDYMLELKRNYNLNKISIIVPGGTTGQLSIYNGLKVAEERFGREDNIALIHDGVRPLIDEQTITCNIKAVQMYGSAITCAPVTETIVLVNNSVPHVDVLNRSECCIAKAPQSFWLGEVLDIEEDAIQKGNTNVIDTCTLMKMYGKKLHIVAGSSKNIKITTPEDFFMFRALYDIQENQQFIDI